MIVLDANIIAKWFFEEELTSLSLKYKDNHINGKNLVVVPDLLFFEIGNVLLYKKNINNVHLKELMKNLINLELKTVIFGVEEYLLSLHYGNLLKISFYDAAYISLAKVLQINFITADKKLFNKIKHLKFIYFLGDL